MSAVPGVRAAATPAHAPVRRAAVLGAGTMGAQIACLLAGRGVLVELLDVDAGSARAGLERAARLSPAPLYVADDLAAITTGALDELDDRVAGADWVLEAVVERLDVKRDLLARAARVLPETAVLATNTSSLSVAAMADALPATAAARFLGMHFFNPPRYTRLVELVPAATTAQVTIARASDIAGELLGKSVVTACDSPGFIANRLGTHASLAALRLAGDLGLGVDEVDDLTGPLLGRPRSAVFRTIDLVGLDIFASVVRTLEATLPADDPERGLFRLPDVVQAMLDRGLLGTKAGMGFYRKDAGEILALDLDTMEYRPRRRARSATVELARNLDDPGRRLAALVHAASPDAATSFVRRLVTRSLWYAAAVAPEIARSIADVDRAMRWGLGWAAGPFEAWDQLGESRMADALLAEGLGEPPLAVAAGLAGGWYTDDGARQLDIAWRRQDAPPGEADQVAPPTPAAAGERPTAGPHVPARVPVPSRARVVELAAIRRGRGALASNPAASLLRLDDVLVVELHGKLNVIGLDTIDMLERGAAEGYTRGIPLVVATDAADFSAGANLALLLLEAEDGEWDELDRVVRRFQAAMRTLRSVPVPVVAAIRGRTLGGGCEIAVAADRVQAAAETYMGFVELGMGLIPAGGGSTEMARRAADADPGGTWGDMLPAFARRFESIATAAVSTSAAEARGMGLLRPEDAISIDPDRAIADAVTIARGLLETGYRPALELPVRVLGRRGLAAAESLTHNQLAGHFISEYDRLLALELARVMCGGDVGEGTQVSVAYMHELEREAFLRLLGDSRTRDRIRGFLRTGKPVRN